MPERTASAADEQIRRLIERLVFEANRSAKGPNPEAIHDLRVAIRRAEQALITFKPLLPRKTVKRIRKQLKPVLSAAGEVRDSDVAIKILLKLEHPGVAELRRDIRARRKTAERGLLNRLKRLSLRTKASQWLADLELHAVRAGPTETRVLAAKLLPRLVKRFFAAGAAAADHHSGDKLHEFRIHARKLRYKLELFVPVYGAAMEERIQRIKSVQSVLGKMNDYRSVLAMASEAGCDKKLKASLKRSGRRHSQEFREIWSEQFTSAVAAEWQRALKAGRHARRIPRKPITSSTMPAREIGAARA